MTRRELPSASYTNRVHFIKPDLFVNFPPCTFSQSITGTIGGVFFDNEQSLQIHSTGRNFIWSFKGKHHKWRRPYLGLLLAWWPKKQIRCNNSLRNSREQTAGLHFEWRIQIVPETCYGQFGAFDQLHNVLRHLWAHWWPILVLWFMATDVI